MGKCAVPGCNEKNRVLFCTPYTDREKRDIWIKQIGLKPKRDQNSKELIYVCESHFEKRHITNCNNKRLSITAIPTLNLPERSNARQLDEEIEKLLKKINANRIVRIPNRLTVLLYKCQNNINNASAKIDIFKELSVRMYLNNPDAYRCLVTTLNLLPVNVIYKTLSLEFQSIEQDKLFQRLIKLKPPIMTKDQKECYISVEEINLEPNYYYHIQRDMILGLHHVGVYVKPQVATTAIVLTLHGISGKWKQCACIGFVNKDFDTSSVWQWVRIATAALLTKLEFKIKAIIYRADAKYLNREETCFEMSQNKIYYICEASSLLKVLFYNWMTKGYCFEQKFPSKQHLVDYLNLDSNTLSQMRPNFSYEDLNPTSLEELNISCVKKVFCYETAAALLMYVEKGDLDKSVKDTGNFILEVVNLINSLNPKVLDSKNMNAETTHLSYLQIALKKFSNLKFSIEAYKHSAQKQRDDFVEQLDITINSILLWHKDNKESDRSYIPFYHYNYDYGYFQSILDKVLAKKKHLKCSAKTIDLIFRQVMTRDFLRPYNKNPRVDVETTLRYVENCSTNLTMDGIGKIEICKIARADYKDFKIGKENSMDDLCNALLARAWSTHEDCEPFNRFMSQWNKYRVTSIQNQNIQKFKDFVSDMESTFKKTIENAEAYIYDGKFVKKIINVFDTTKEFQNSCKCFPTQYVKKLFIRFRIYHMLKKTNAVLKTSTSNTLELNL